MYVILLMCLMTSFVSTRKDAYVIHLSPNFVKTVQHIIEKCEKETKSPPNTFKNMLAGRTDDESVLAFMYCYLPEAGYLTKDGLLKVDSFANFIKRDDLKAEFIKTAEECNKLKKDNPLETLRLVSDCYFKNTPVDFAV